MPKMSAVTAAALRWFCMLGVTATMIGAAPAKAEWDRPWRDADRALVIDAYEFNPINWKEMTGDKRIAGFINKASDGLPPDWSCKGLQGDDEKLCKNRWWKYTVTQELYLTRREMAKTLGLKWGAYHLARPGNPREQADHFIDFAQPEADDLIALDIEDNTSEWMSLEDAETFARQVFIRIGRYPVLYTNGNTASYIAKNRETYPLLSRLQLWYARYREDLTGVFPQGNWDQYALWQFSSMHNCNARKCPYRVAGARNDIDVNVSPLSVAELQKAWPFDGLVGPDPVVVDPGSLIAKVDRNAKDLVEEVGREVAELALPDAPVSDADKPVADTLAAAYGPSRHAPVDPLQLLNEATRQEHAATPAPVLSALSQGPKTDPTPGQTPLTFPGNLERMRDEMSIVRSVVGVPTTAAATQVESALAKPTGATLRSRIAEIMRAAAETIEGKPPEPAGTLERRSDLVRGDWMVVAHLAPIDRRITKAFRTTR
ncbi:Glycosyl hydrolases family 25 [Aureimonas jatrophae]|uniref:Glycosyl hydrolases family 25 n=2 Tax=Aureimonas jatrophae TaxID=1166073 RepID=A0A1H0GMF5_9HYPH|nr:Glycosyl hydrolases family 25 [Aureimonas jatrophae]